LCEVLLMGVKMDAYNAARRATRNMVECYTCGAVFHRPPALAKLNTRQFCSRDCYRENAIGPGNANWRGGEIGDGRGRVMVYAPNHPNANLYGGTHIFRYRLVASRILGRPLRDDEVVHHINGDSSDDRPENLCVISQSEHAKLHNVKGKFVREAKNACA
jgi:hypothetical protein